MDRAHSHRIGTGFIKPNLSTVVGGLYDDGDPRRDQGFLYFSMSINVGSLITGLLKDHFGYHVGFIAAAIGMALALCAFVYGRSKLRDFTFDIPHPLGPGEGRKLALGAVDVVAVGLFAISRWTQSTMDDVDRELGDSRTDALG